MTSRTFRRATNVGGSPQQSASSGSGEEVAELFEQARGTRLPSSRRSSSRSGSPPGALPPPPRSASPTRRSASPRRPASSPEEEMFVRRGGRAGGTFIINPKTGKPINTVNNKGETGAVYKALLDDPMYARQAREAQRYSEAQARALAKQRSQERGTVSKPQVAWYNTSTGRVKMLAKGTNPAGDVYRFPVDVDAAGGEEQAKLRVKMHAYEAGLKKTKPTGTTGKTRKVSADARFVRVPNNKPTSAGGGRQPDSVYIRVGGPEWNRRVAQGENLRGLPQLSDAQKRAESAERSNKGKRLTATELADKKRRDGARLRALRGVEKEYVFCIKNPTTNRPIGVQDANTGKVSAKAREVARDYLGVANATKKSGGLFVVSDAQIVAAITGGLKAGKLVYGSGKKCDNGRRPV